MRCTACDPFSHVYLWILLHRQADVKSVVSMKDRCGKLSLDWTPMFVALFMFSPLFLHQALEIAPDGLFGWLRKCVVIRLVKVSSGGREPFRRLFC